jgi:hypothetical protein
MFFCFPANISTAQKFFVVQLKGMDMKMISAKYFMDVGRYQSLL